VLTIRKIEFKTKKCIKETIMAVAGACANVTFGDTLGEMDCHLPWSDDKKQKIEGIYYE